MNKVLLEWPPLEWIFPREWTIFDHWSIELDKSETFSIYINPGLHKRLWVPYLALILLAKGLDVAWKSFPWMLNWSIFHQFFLVKSIFHQFFKKKLLHSYGSGNAWSIAIIKTFSNYSYFPQCSSQSKPSHTESCPSLWSIIWFLIFLFFFFFGPPGGGGAEFFRMP